MLTVCSYCSTDFPSVKRHEWRCKEKPNAHSTKSSMFAQRTSQDNIPIIENQTRTNYIDSVKCCCGKKCKGLRGLKSHQRSCRVIKCLNEEMVSTNDTKIDEIINDNINDFIVENLPELKPGIKLPKTETGWKEANTYLKSVLHVKCCCGKKFKGLTDLKSHQRSCRVIKGLNEEMVSTNETETDEIMNDNIGDFIAENLLELKPGIKLPKTETGWKEANTYLRSVLHAGDININ